VQALGDAEFDRAYEIGNGLTLEEAYDVALGRIDPK
jgi:hypothetical protein